MTDARRIGLLAAAALMLAEAVTQFVDFGVYDLRIQALNSASADSLFGVLSVCALAAAALAALLRDRRLGLLLAVVLALRVTHMPYVLAISAPFTLGAFVLLWRRGATDPLLRAACALLVVAIAVHGPGEIVVRHLGIAEDTWIYQAKVVVKHAFELGGWLLVATALAVRAAR